ncbi:MAG: LytTR family DNA-binding domain-containing protein [Cytophagales bacterium]|nr:LytTR family DNA-binding domain-containing protein [Cytophagales bacterium]
MKVIIVEDERLSAERLRHLVLKIDSTITVLDILPSVQKAAEWFRANSCPDLVFLDIQLSDGTAFDLLKSLTVSPPVIFTTAYDEFALKAFNYNSIQYLLKPIEMEELDKALEKFKAMDRQPLEGTSLPDRLEQVQKTIKNEYKRRFLIKIGDQYQNVEVSQVAYVYYHDGSCLLKTREGKEFLIDYSLDQLEDILNPLDFFRVNRQFIVKADAIKEIHAYFNSRLLLRLAPGDGSEIIVSRDRVNHFKRWMDS